MVPTASPLRRTGSLRSRMLRTRTTRTAAALLVVTTLGGAIPGSAAAPAATVNSAATGGAPATNVTAPGDLVSVYNFGPLQQGVIDAATAAATDAGGVGVLGRGFGIGMIEVTRGAAVVHQAPGPLGSWFFPMSVSALPIDSIGVAMGRDVSAIISQNQVVMGATSAALVGAQAGDILHLEAADGSVAQFLVGRVAPDEEVGGTEIVM